MVRARPKALVVTVVGFLLATAGCSQELQPTTPFWQPTHHAVLEGVVVGADGQPLGSIGVSTLYAASSPPERRANVVGGATTDANGAFRLEVRAFSRRLPGADAGTIDVYLRAWKAGPPGGQVVENVVLVTLRVVPLSEPPQVTRVADIRLPVQ